MTKPTIELSESVFKKIQVLSPENQKQILDFLESITANSDETQEKKATRISGLYQGQGWISDDFNDPLTNEFFAEI
jgi:mRNA-degrading endonuclease RelE of RelBE toxin-antitoxin system